MKIKILLLLIIAQAANADRVKVIYGERSSFISDNCNLLYMLSSDVEYLDAGINDRIHSEFYFSCDQDAPKKVDIPDSESRLYINGLKFKCPLLKGDIENGVVDYEFDCTPQVIFKNGFEPIYP